MPKTGSIVVLAAGLMASILLPTSPLYGQPAGVDLSVKAGVGIEYLNRTLSWDENTFTSGLKGLLFALQAEVEVRKGLSVGIQAGYALSDFGGLIFRELPFSVEYQAGNMGGLYLGGSFKARASISETFDIELTAALDAYFGSRGEWDLEGLAVEGALEGRPFWTRIAVGPVLWYKGLSYYVYPYVQVLYTPLWGSFRMTETVEALEGTEKKAVAGSGRVTISLGVLSEISDAIGIRAEVYAGPRKGGLDIGGSGRLIFSF
ncbi:MAG: hypothetical protein A2Y56_12215 [Candidatus Aminicenantes bacterium RBG_13_63_10]|nr:MAG: hypothetical protein A2Y56_12215 [Candidatus Aminicenantes bacterium RBG_13_63_10]